MPGGQRFVGRGHGGWRTRAVIDRGGELDVAKIFLVNEGRHHSSPFTQVLDVWAQSSARESARGQDLRTVEDHGASWRHSADTATIERRSKVIDGRIRVARRAEKWRRSALERRRSQPLSASVAGVRGAVPVVPNSA